MKSKQICSKYCREVGVSKTTVNKVSENGGCVQALKLQLLRASRPGDNVKSYGFAVDVLDQIEADAFS